MISLRKPLVLRVFFIAPYEQRYLLILLIIESAGKNVSPHPRQSLSECSISYNLESCSKCFASNKRKEGSDLASALGIFPIEDEEKGRNF